MVLISILPGGNIFFVVVVLFSRSKIIDGNIANFVYFVKIPIADDIDDRQIDC